jgi:hypothetical protein
MIHSNSTLTKTKNVKKMTKINKQKSLKPIKLPKLKENLTKFKTL